MIQYLESVSTMLDSTLSETENEIIFARWIVPMVRLNLTSLDFDEKAKITTFM